MYQIYINEIVLIITDSAPLNIQNHQQIDTQEFNFLLFYNLHKKDKKNITYLLLTDHPKRLFKNVKKYMRLIEAAGGLVKNEEKKFLFIFRKGKWDLPKGKLDEGEKTKRAAVREVEEECGIKVSALGKKLGKTWHVYEMGGKVILKKTTWYYMKAKKQKLVPQAEEDITEARWIGPAEIGMVKQNTYPLIADLIAYAGIKDIA